MLAKKNLLLAVIAIIVAIALIVTAVVVYNPQEKENEDTLIVAISSDVKNWYLTQFADGDARFVWAQIYGTLIRLDTDLNLIPGLASSWYTPDNGKTWIFNLTQGVRFHDGSEFNADAVLFSYGNDTYVRNYGVLARVNYLEKVDNYTVRFVMKSPTPLPYYLTHIAWPVMSPNMANPDGSWNGKIIGTGPFKFNYQITDQEIVLDRYENYSGPAPLLKRIIFKVIKDPTTRVLALKAGDVDMIIKVSEQDVADLEATSGIHVQHRLTTFTDFLQFNTKTDPHNASVSPFTDLRVRKAVAYGIDTEKIVNDLLDGIGMAAKGRPYSPVMLYSDPSLPLYEYNVTKAKSLLMEAGYTLGEDGYFYKNGSKLSTTILMTSEDPWAPRFTLMSQAIASMLRDIGMDVTVESVPTAVFNSKEASGDFGMILRTGYFVWGPYPRHFAIHTSSGLWSHYQNASYDQLFRLADTTINVTLQEEYFRQLQRAVIDDLPAFYLVHEHKIVAYRDVVKGYVMTAEDPWLNLEGVSVER
ncbi:MAG: ABC transporter substrate-binding protein [Methanomassiliicoccales archaeon]|nr:ABC transporter substrate-binding protein [Methanomassiliicoccales archaeon]